jgi:L-aminopeptidase/D-esterase-like protein
VPVDLLIPGVEIGHWTDAVARTGCTVIVLPPGTTASGEVRGGAPATRDFALLAPERLVECVDAVVLAGGSAFGLAAADGVMEVLEGEGRGFETPHGPVPIVVAMALYDLGVGDPAVRPDAAAGHDAATNRATSVDTGPVGAGTGATVSKWLGAENAESGGLGIATVQRDELVVSAVVALNAAGSPPPGAHQTLEQIADGSFQQWKARSSPFTNTTLCAVITNAALSKLDCFWVAQGGHDGLARELVPAHTRSDGDAVVAAATGDVPADTDDVRLLAVAAVARAVRSAAATAEG